MNFIRRRFLSITGATITGLAASPLVCAQAYPARSVRVIVPFAPGGGPTSSPALSCRNCPNSWGSSSMSRTCPVRAATSAQDKLPEHTRRLHRSLRIQLPCHESSMFDKLPYDPVRDFAPVTLAVTSPAVLTINPSVPAKTMEDLIALIKASPGKYSFASGGTGTRPYLAGEQLRLSLGLDLGHVPHNGGGPALVSVLGGHVPMSFTTLSPAVPHIKDGMLRALAVTSRTRSQTVPDVPTMTEAGYPDIEGDTWVGVLVPIGTDPQIITLLNREIVKIVKLATMKERLVQLGYEPVGTTPDEYGVQIRTEITKWATVIRSAGIRTQ